jgi:transcriptional regulator with XRE-family HTH domain
VDTTIAAAAAGDLIRGWRQRRRLSQLELANLTGVSTRHLSFLETGRSMPSRTMVLHLAEHLDLPLRDRNQLLLSAGFAPVHPESSLHSPQMLAIREALARSSTVTSPSRPWWWTAGGTSSRRTTVCGCS